ncbi:transcriptional regulator [Flavivirga sp. 57AJ16]|uniref:helix-turn-helix and ligand-binding sensor domain-containing protein n=1 Tax=Flavivirga sp. 57AJ16 TaxID=3025307 RepID=UPI002365D5C7|nr:transcriptional regulator [Flavivirga sp. 57AJ16]MDD7888301.1 transcriptional regulator [Flavivirga sp. 57AJ16]
MITLNKIEFRAFIILLILLVEAPFVFAQYTPFFQNYALTEFNAGNQNWGVSFAENGKLYVANDKGLLEFDGVKWDFYQLPNKTIIRSVLAINNRIYTGSYEEFGYWEKTKKGVLEYTSLSNFNEDNDAVDEEFWQILSVEDNILFRSFSNLYIYKEGRTVKVRPKSTIISCSKINDTIYVSTLEHGIFSLQEETLIQLKNTERLTNTKIISISESNQKFLITTALKGCFLYSNNKLEVWESPITNIIREHQLNKFLVLKNGNMVFGTIKNGVYITNKSGDILFHISKENGLQNSTVLSLCLGANNNLWVGLDNGVTVIDLNYNYLLYNDNSGELGAVYDIINYDNKTYIGSNTGLFYLKENDNKLNFVEESQGQVWDLIQINNQLFCGHNNGTFLVENNKLNKISGFTGGWVMKKVPEQDNIFIQGTYAGLVRYKYINGKWDVKHLDLKTTTNPINYFTIPIKYLVFENKYTAWVAHAYKGVYKIKFDSEYEKIIDIVDYKDKGLLSEYNVKVFNIKNDICFKTNEGWQKYEALIDSIVPNNLLNKTFGKETDIISQPNTDGIVTKNKNDKISFIFSLTNKETNLSLPNKLFQKRLVVDAESVSQIKDSVYALNLYGGFMIINKTEQVKQAPLQKPIIERVEIDKNLVEISNSNSYQLPFNMSISISISSPSSNNHFFEYSISNSDSLNWSRMENEKLELSRLGNDDYAINFRSVNISGNTSPINTIHLKVLPPWYKNTYSYLITAILITIIMYWLHKRKIAKEQRLLHQKLKKEQEIILKEKAIENDKKIVQLKNESLKSEVKLKSKQLANTAMALVKKNESMLEIKNELIKSRPGFQNTLAYKKLLKKIDNSIGHEDEWQIFEYNFNQVHEEFFNKLKSKHPKLTHKDLKICAYIKMNLLTKEIAPLMNVSIRGLETQRYRLKRKLNLENDKSLTDYLKNFT